MPTKPFPDLERQMEVKSDEDYNPSIRLFGRRFFSDQTVPELLIEFLLVATSMKKIGGKRLPDEALFPSLEQIRAWPPLEPLQYAPKARLNLKLFAFLGASKLDTRHESHRRHYRDLISAMKTSDKLSAGSLDKDEILRTLENLFLGFQSVGGQRTWCAQAFLPVTSQLVSGESIWREKKAQSAKVRDWEDSLGFFSHAVRLFLARGGELLYLQVCNALRSDEALLKSWCRDVGLSLSSRESSPVVLHEALERALSSALNACPETVGSLAEFLDTGVDPLTAKQTDFAAGGPNPRFVSCGWCPEECWPEGLLFCVELLRLCEAVIDPIERLEMLEIACAMQLLRSLCAQSARYAVPPRQARGPLGYVWAFSDPAGEQVTIKQISRRNVNAVQRLIHGAIRHPDIESTYRNDIERTKIYKEADRRYGHKLFLTMAKRIGLIIPKRGSGARFVLNDRLLRFLVLSLLRPGERVTYESFKELLRIHYGIAVDDNSLAESCEWSGTPPLTTLGGASDTWLTEMLDASGVLIQLSDSCSLVMNPFASQEVSQ